MLPSVNAIVRASEAHRGTHSIEEIEAYVQESRRAWELARQVALVDSLKIPPKEALMISRGEDREGHRSIETKAIIGLRQAMADGLLMVILWGPPGTGKSNAACRILAELCQVSIERDGLVERVDVWSGGVYLRAPDFARMADWEEDRLAAIWGARHLVLDDLGEEEEFGEKATAKLRTLLTRRDDQITKGTTTIITTNLTPTQLGARYHQRVFDRMRELGRWIQVTEIVRPRRGK
jgi:hypothetical protein